MNADDSERLATISIKTLKIHNFKVNRPYFILDQVFYPTGERFYLSLILREQDSFYINAALPKCQLLLNKQKKKEKNKFKKNAKIVKRSVSIFITLPDLAGPQF